ncbi:KAP P-loop domain protein [endosymbiont of Riftia pachyptila (vent Ph05)]|jgi:hypothetical protein|uniref:KAP P-loop domain protein n=1 Tax=endosymbiont of Riftia pachyptila (vent Ph05) TaxID=1048808 RepID=G2DD89_9GAMM|nr:KAP P-loop domain protein [endosymbiont of Riftia pachyptila (vent Ph05)]
MILIVAVDERMALAALAQHYYELAEKGSQRTAQAIARDYLGKIFHLPVCLSDPAKEDVENYILKDLIVEVLQDADLSSDKKKGSSGTDASGELTVRPGPHGAEPGQQVAPGSLPGDSAVPAQQKLVDEMQPSGGEVVPEETGAEEGGKAPKEDKKRTQLLAGKAIRETTKERELFMQLADWLKISNPRRLKRLLNSYRLMKALDAGRRGTIDLMWNKRHLTMLFWLEHLYVQEMIEQKREEKYLFGPDMEIQGAKLAPKTYCLLMEEMAKDVAEETRRSYYEMLKLETMPFMLPFSHIVVESQREAKQTETPLE